MDEKGIRIPAVVAAAECVGSVSRLAIMLGIKRPALYQWTRVPAERVSAIVAATGGRITRHQLRPDLYPLDEELTERPATTTEGAAA